jgi:hypothetical protein
MVSTEASISACQTVFPVPSIVAALIFARYFPARQNIFSRMASYKAFQTDQRLNPQPYGRSWLCAQTAFAPNPRVLSGRQQRHLVRAEASHDALSRACVNASLAWFGKMCPLLHFGLNTDLGGESGKEPVK